MTVLSDLAEHLTNNGGAMVLGRTGYGPFDVLIQPFHLSELKISDAVVTPRAGGLVVTGRTRLPRLPVDARVIVTSTFSSEAEPAAVLRISLLGSPDILTLFGPGQPSSLAANDQGYIDSVPSVIGTLVINNGVFTTQSGDTAGGTFTGDMAVDQASAYSLASYTPFPISPTVSLSGTWQGDLTTGAQFTLFGSSASGVTLPSFITDYGLRLSNQFNVLGGESDTPVSGAAFYMTSNLDGAILTVPLLYNDGHWAAYLSLTQHVTLGDGVDELMALLGEGAAGTVTLPPGLDLFSSFYVDHLHLGLDPGAAGEAPSVTLVGVGIGSDATWRPPIPIVDSIGGLGATFLYSWPTADMPGIMTAGINGSLTLGKEPASQLTLDCSLSLPTFDINITQQAGRDPDFGQFLSNVIGTAVLPANWSLTLDQFQASILMAEREFHAVMELQGQAPLGDAHIQLTELGGRVDIYPNDVQGSVWAQLTIAGDGHSVTPTPDDIVFAIQADYGGSEGGWTFEGGLGRETQVDIARFVAAMTGEPAPAWLTSLNIAVESVWFSYSTEANYPYSASGALSATIPLDSVLGFDIKIAATATAIRDGNGVKSGSLGGSFQVGDLTVTGTVGFVTPQTWDFKVQWKDVIFDAVTTPVVDHVDKTTVYNVIRITLTGVTLGDLVTDFIEMIDPNLDVTLDAPWSVLNDIEMSRARLSIDNKYSTLTVELEIGLDLGFVDIDTVRLIYDRSSPKGSIRYEIEGMFLGQSYGGDTPLSWDAINDPPPAVPAKGNSLLDIHYMGLGQHINIGQPTSINAALIAMANVLVPPEGSGNPIPVGAFSPDVGWVAGLDMTLMGFIGLRLVFDDPDLYGLHVALNGEEAKALNGLSIDLTYRKVSSTVGVFNVQLALPDAYRQIELGAVSVTLGVISVSVYTDGGFEIDLGFPHGGDFTNAYVVEAGPFLGRGGLYFGLLESGGSSRVPLATNGNFAPTVEAGVGFAGGLGRDFNKGPLSAGAYVQLEAILEGALAWYHPTDAAQPVDTYYYCRATAGIAGQVYGSVDFGIISASISISAQATSTLVLEACRATMVDLDAEVSVSASVHFLFFSVSFSFDLNLELSFPIGDDTAAPWILAAGAGGDGAQRLDHIYARSRRTARRGLQYIYDAHLKTLQSPIALNWNDKARLWAAPQSLNVTIVPALTMDAPLVQWTSTPVAPPSPLPTTLVTFTPSTVQGSDGVDPIDTLIQAMLLWSLSAASQLIPDTVDVGVLVDLNSQMSSDDTRAQFSWDKLNNLFGQNLLMVFQDFDAGALVSGSVLPMPRTFVRTDAATPSAPVNYETQTPISPEYEAALAQWIDALNPGGPAATDGKTRIQSPDESFPSMIFHSYFLTMAKAIVSEAATVAGAWTYTLGDSLADQLIATLPPRQVTYVKAAGDTIDTAAAAYGVSVSELVFFLPGIADTFAAATPGTPINFDIGVTPQSIVAGNPALTLSGTVNTIDLAPLVWQTSAADTLSRIAGASLAQWLAQPKGVSNAISTDVRVLQAGAPLTPTGFSWTAQIGVSVAQRDATLYVRFTDAPAATSAIDATLTSWCSSRIQALNPGLQFSSSGEPIWNGATLTVPADQVGGTANWVLLPGDTLSRIARANALFVSPAAAPLFSDFVTAMAAANPKPGQPIVLPTGVTTAVLANESLVALAERMLMSVTDDQFLIMVKDAAILAPMQSLVAPVSLFSFDNGTSMQTIATACGLSLEAVGERIATTEGLFAKGTPVPVAHAPSLNREDLVTKTLAVGAPRVRAQMSRFMMQGMRLPEPAADNLGFGPSLVSLASLSGLETPLSNLLDAGNYTSTFDEGDTDWIQLPSSGVTVTMASSDVTGHLPYPVLSPGFVNPETPASPAALTRDIAVHWDLSQRLLWMTPSWPQDLLGPDPQNGAPASLWPISSALLNAYPTLGANTGLSLCRIDPQAPPGTTPDVLLTWGLGTRVDIAIRQTGAPEVYEVVGIDSSQNDLLLSLWQDIASPNFDISFLYQPPAAAGAPTGLASSAIGAAASVIIQTNLSTAAHGGPQAIGDDRSATNPFAAASTDPDDFLRLIWECGVVGGGGYWLQIATADGQGLPDAVFDRNGRATITLLVVETAQSGKAVQTLEAFHNIVLVGDPVAPATSHVFLSSTTMQRAIALMDVGKVGFEVDLFNPVGAPKRLADGAIDSDPALRTRQTFQLLGYRLAGSQAFNASPIGLPVPPKSIGSDGAQWRFGQTLPVYRFARLGSVPDVVGLPSPVDDPYGGINLASDGSGAAPATVELWFQDLFGNATAGSPVDVQASGEAAVAVDPAGVYALDIPSLYTDPVLSIDQWPSTTALYRVNGPVAAPVLEIDIGLKLSAYSPSAGQLGGALSKTIIRHRDQFALIWYQIHRPDFSASLSTSLQPGSPLKPYGLDGFRNFAGAAYAYLSAAAELVDDTANPGCQTIDQICLTYGVSYSDLAQVNGDIILGDLFKTCTIPSFVTAHAGLSLADQIGATPAAAVLAMASNGDLTLPGDIELVIPLTPVKVAETGSLTAVAKIANCSVDSLALASADLAWFAPDITLTSGSASVATTTTMSLNDAVAALVAQGAPTTALGLARFYAGNLGLVAGGAGMSTTGWLTKGSNTLADKASGYDQATLAPLNVGVANLYPAGTPIDTHGPAATAADLERSLSAVSSVHGVSLEQLISSWAGDDLIASAASQFKLPGRVLLPENPQTLRVPYTIQAGDALPVLAPKFLGGSPGGLVADNWDAPNTMAAGVKIKVGAETVVAQIGDSFHRTALRFADLIGPAQISAAIGALPDALNPGALLICPAALSGPVSAANAGSKAWTLTDLAAVYGVQPNALGMANAGLADWLAPDAVFKFAGLQVPATTGDISAYSITSVVAAFRQAGLNLSAAELIAANLDAPLIAEGKTFLLPPNSVSLIEPLPSGASYPAPIFPISATLTFSRNPLLVAPALLVNSTATLQGVTQIAPDATGAQALDPQTPPPLNYLTFAKRLQASLPQLLVCSGTVGANAQPGQLWAVATNTGGLSGVAVSADPSFYAMRPLYPQPVSRDNVVLTARKKDGGAKTSTDVRNADVEVWARTFLNDLETFLDAGHALKVYNTSDKAAAAQQQVLADKGSLALAIAAGCENLKKSEAGPGPARHAARDELVQSLTRSLVSGWSLSAMLQYPVTTVGPNPCPVRLPVMPQLMSAGLATAQGQGTGLRTILTGGAVAFDAPSSFLQFAATIAPSDDACTQLPLTPSLKQVEFNIAPVKPLPYETSDWLSFLTPVACDAWTIQLGAPVVPVLARSYPSTPLPIAQTSGPDLEAGGGWQAAPLWRYEMSFSYAAAPQDQVVFGVTFNVTPANRTKTQANPGLFEQLANYQSIRDSLWNDIDNGDVEAGSVDLAAAVEGILPFWTAHWKDEVRDRRMKRLHQVGGVHAADGPAAAGVAFIGTLVHAHGLYVALVVQPFPNQTSQWPEIGVELAGVTHRLVPEADGDDRRIYAFPPAVTIITGAPIIYHVSLGGLHVASRQEACGGISVIRNAALLGLDEDPISEDFVYRAPPALFPHTVAPYLSFVDPFDAGDWSPVEGPNNLVAILQRLTTGPDAALEALSIEVRSDSGVIAPSLPMRLPVAYSPQTQYPGTVAMDIEAKIKTWAKTWEPPQGQWEIIVTAYATIEDRLNEPLIVARLLFNS
jgi:hypothetical protein